MNLKSSVVIALVLLLGCKTDKKQGGANPKKKQAALVEDEGDYHNPSVLIEAEALHKIISTDSVKVIDFRKPEAYSKGHLPNAINISRSDVQQKELPYKGVMLERTALEKLFSKKGISNTDVLVIYDGKGECDAARLWWVLYVNGFYNVKLLNGGLDAWQAIKGEETTQKPNFSTTKFKFPEQFRMPLITYKEDVKQLVEAKDAVVLLDTRTKDEFTGKTQKKGAFKAGHIPKAQLFDWANAIDYNGTKKFKSYKDLKYMYSQFAKDKNQPITVYCHTGVRSAHTTFVLTQLLGYTNVKNYDGSWCEWSYFKDLPVEIATVE